MAKTQAWYVYLLRCADKTLYTGITINISRRMKQHNTGRGAKYTRARSPVILVSLYVLSNRSEASQLEYKIKSMTKKEKEHWIKQYPLFQA
jgi:putative endonuclease